MSIDLRSEMQGIMEKLEEANKAYYAGSDDSSPVMTDTEYDTLKKHLQQLSKEHPVEATDLDVEGFLSNVGTKVNTNEYAPMYHNPPMLSLDNSFNDGDLTEWNGKTKAAGARQWVTTGKFDGLAWENVYENGKLVQGGTRGNGDVGEDLTASALQIPGIPKTIAFKDRLCVRGEIVLSWKAFEKAKELDNQEYANPRNAAAGIARRKKVGESVKLLTFMVYGMHVEGSKFSTYTESMDWLTSLGFTVADFKVASDLPGALANVAAIDVGRVTADFMMDGAVTRVNDYAVFESMGYTSHHPKAAIASKFAAEQAETTLLDVEWTRGKKGKLSPNARLETILLAGTRVSNALMHTMKIINALDIRIGDTVVVEKAAEIIPQVVGVRADLRKGTERKIVAPSHCHVCNTPIEMRGEYVYCVNKDCGDAAKNKLLTYVDKIDFKGIGPSAAEKLAANGAFQEIPDFYALSEADFEAAGVAPKNAVKLVAAIKDSVGKNKPKQILAGLSIDMCGVGTSEDLTQEAALTIRELCNQPQTYFQKIRNIGEKTAESLASWFNTPVNVALVEKLYGLGVIVDDNADAKRQVSLDEKVLVGQLSDLPFISMKICITGTLSNSRPYYVDLIEKNGGKWASAYQKSIDVLVVGADAGSKLSKARKDGVKVWTESDFLGKVIHY